jgi:methoxymalonate biosynthesis acyl carrier protein
MTTEQHATVTTLTADSIERALIEFLADKVQADIDRDLDLFASGLVSSMFAMQLVVHVESTYDIAIIGPELTLDNFRSVAAMAALVLRLRGESGASA